MPVIELLAHPYTQAVFWSLCILFSIYFASASRNFSFGKDTGTRAWGIIAIALLVMGIRVTFKIIPSYNTSFILQIVRFSIGIIGVTALYFGFEMFKSTLWRMYGAD